jgi:hypothetical protein
MSVQGYAWERSLLARATEAFNSPILHNRLRTDPSTGAPTATVLLLRKLGAGLSIWRPICCLRTNVVPFMPCMLSAALPMISSMRPVQPLSREKHSPTGDADCCVPGQMILSHWPGQTRKPATASHAVTPNSLSMALPATWYKPGTQPSRIWPSTVTVSLQPSG